MGEQFIVILGLAVICIEVMNFRGVETSKVRNKAKIGNQVSFYWTSLANLVSRNSRLKQKKGKRKRNYGIASYKNLLFEFSLVTGLALLGFHKLGLTKKKMTQDRQSRDSLRLELCPSFFLQHWADFLYLKLVLCLNLKLHLFNVISTKTTPIIIRPVSGSSRIEVSVIRTHHQPGTFIDMIRL